MFRNLRLYRLHSAWPDSELELSNLLGGAAFAPCGPFTERSSGWEAPAGDDPDMLCRRVGGADLLRLRSQSRVLPAAAVREALDDRIQQFRARTQRDPGRKEKRELKEEVYEQLLPKTLLKSDRINGFYLAAEKLIGVDTASATVAERFMDQLRAALTSLKVTPLAFKQPVAGLMSRVFLGDAPAGFAPGRECRMQDPSSGGTSVQWLDIDLADPSIRRHVKDGLQLTRLALVYDNVMGCVIDQDGVLRKIRFQGLDAADDEAVDEDPLARLDAEFVMLTGTLRGLIGALKKALGGYD